VIAATYANFEAAQKRAGSLQKRSGQLKASVFPPDGQGRYYFVVLGSGMSQKQAENLRSRAVQLGAPRDTYVTKLADR
jgi:hypothetical protein